MTEKRFKSKIKTVADAFKARNQKPYKLSDFSIIRSKDRKSNLAYNNLIIIIEALNAEVNGGKIWTPDYADYNYKYEIWWNIKADNKRPSGFGLSYSDCDYWGTISYCGFRLCFISRDVALYCAKQFKKEWENYILLEK